MTKELQIFMEYKVKQEMIEEYEKLMSSILQQLEVLGATDINWFVASDQPYLYVEMFKVETHRQYEEIKQIRQSTSEPIFGKMIPLIEGGEKKIHCWAFERKE
ncbi:hypothetical protein AJ85_05985 [Alkalihalobacillus alcalophilus ATCC 27647 = CGMCC 1.3604]|uniref:NIPSNAP domain-containing protein n=1 Tax=Alkalihalobacillus alcalophilus ATCC 27647 = CGMCC 1.3604 TaxID=1218173 RepID=A0A094WP04_ALKAL|nr:hypothetical protein [Alkalihalobacillus alcalophilus]KGA97693.1 hypothetical protein BALCAV_0208650 [Alkalihalobacillus alcalophilus ATCC 27647 = CGMCC 1.3604]MED1562569.1 hypothetical protein [Alkalihalobacillus alcalophilus]THG91274.1 hypothetical protein AJ85_05985 [Alkalihalobacillus alcalophilus ATCC 27647 = CGMCC 1.3604]